MRRSRALGSSRGQIVIPSLFVIPCLMLFVYLIYETAKLSREKIRHQFAVDAAAFVEMTNYADFLNRTAYVNGAFPQRIFAEGFMESPDIQKKSGSGTDTLYQILWRNGAFPRQGGEKDGLKRLDDQSVWRIRYIEEAATPENRRDRNNDASPQVPDTFHLLTFDDANNYYITWEDAQDIYKLYVQIYQLLGSVVDAQYSVFKRLTGGANPHTFFRKSYWLNTGDGVDDGGEGAAYFSRHTFRPKAECVQKIMIHGNKPTNDPYQPYKIVQPQEPIKMPPTVSGELCSPEGLFQMAYVPPDNLKRLTSPSSGGLSNYPGYAVVQHWKAPGNYFKVPFNDVCALPGGGGPCVHATIALTGPSEIISGKAGVWSNPTPKFQTRLYP